MAGKDHQLAMSPLESKLRLLVAALDEAALEALANKGLLRRAQKDLERGVAVLLEREEGGKMFFKAAQFEVSLPEAGPAKAKCSCPAPGICQHVLMVILFLQRGSSASAPNAEPPVANVAENELLSFTREQLESWAGKANFRAGFELALQCPADIILERGVVVRFAALNAQCHHAPGAGLDGIIVSGGGKDERQLAVAGVIAFQKSKGVAWETTVNPAAALEESAGAPRSRAEVLESAGQLLGEMLDNGLTRLSAARQERWATLAVSAIGVNLPRLALLLRGLSDECALAVARDARCDLGRMLGRMAQTEALCAALQQGGASPRADLVGWHRTHYDEIGHLDLTGVAAWPWRTASGYSGLTVLFWDAAGKRWNSWTDSRPLQQQRDFQPLARYSQPGPWEGADSPRQLSRHAFRLLRARRNPAHRLSGSGKSRVVISGPARLHGQSLPVMEDWTQIFKALEAQVSVGLKESEPLETIFVLKPSAWGPRGYDSVAQVFVWMLLDAQKHPLLLRVGFDPFTEPAIRFLENVEVNSLQEALLIGRVQRTAEGLIVHPYSLHRADGEIVHLCLDTITAARPTPPSAAPIEEEDASAPEEEDGPLPAPNFSLNPLLDELDEVLLTIAETGVAGSSQARLQRLEQMASRADNLNLQALSTGIKNLVNQPQAATLLRCRYLSQLHRAAMPIAVPAGNA